MLPLTELTRVRILEQEDRASAISEIEHHLKGVRHSIKEIQIDLFHLLRHLEELTEVYAHESK